SFAVHPAYAIPEGDEPLEPSLIAGLPPERFAGLQDYIEKLRQRQVDLAICLDCTASMSGEISAAQAGVDDLMLFVGDVVGSLRMGLVAYRDRHDKFETRYWDFTTSIDEARRRLWELSAEGGGDTEESVHLAMHAAYTKLSWVPEHTKVLIVVGDAPPHVGYGTSCIEMAARGATNDLITHTIEAEGKEVKHFAEIAEAGEGRCVSLEDDDLLIPEIAGLTLGEQFEDEFREFFAMYLYLCR
ncbi:MAG: vWA domain-containing protein, partial [Actinomycetota bacterium]|nr:vWA domain-containing protein [Actinomycetota bacterium]